MHLTPPSAGVVLAMLAGVIAVAVGACSDRTPAGPSAPASLVVSAGDRQAGPPGAPLSRPVVVTVRDPAGRPVPAVPVQWSLDGDGTITPLTEQTDAYGRAYAQWTLAAVGGVQRGTAHVSGLPPIEFFATADPSLGPGHVPRLLTVATYDGSGQVVHPDHAATPAGWGADRRYLAITPYPYGDASRENPSLYSGADGSAWQPPPGVTNPLATPSAGHLSDPDMLYVADLRELWIYYRQADAANVIYLIRSRDGVRWSAPVEVARAPSHTLISPAVVHMPDGSWLMWSVNGMSAGCGAPSATVELRRSRDGVSWSAPATVTLSQPGFFPWHIDVQWIPSRNEFWALYNVKRAGSCTTPGVYLATSRDGMTWTTYPSPVLARGALPEFEHVVYRSSFEYDAAADEVMFWFSGARYERAGYVWRSAVQRRRRADLFAQMSADGYRFEAPPGGEPPELTNPP